MPASTETMRTCFGTDLLSIRGLAKVLSNRRLRFPGFRVWFRRCCKSVPCSSMAAECGLARPKDKQRGQAALPGTETELGLQRKRRVAGQDTTHAYSTACLDGPQHWILDAARGVCFAEHKDHVSTVATPQHGPHLPLLRCGTVSDSLPCNLPLQPTLSSRFTPPSFWQFRAAPGSILLCPHHHHSREASASRIALRSACWQLATNYPNPRVANEISSQACEAKGWTEEAHLGGAENQQ